MTLIALCVYVCVCVRLRMVDDGNAKCNWEVVFVMNQNRVLLLVHISKQTRGQTECSVVLVEQSVWLIHFMISSLDLIMLLFYSHLDSFIIVSLCDAIFLWSVEFVIRMICLVSLWILGPNRMHRRFFCSFAAAAAATATTTTTNITNVYIFVCNIKRNLVK